MKKTLTLRVKYSSTPIDEKLRSEPLENILKVEFEVAELSSVLKKDKCQGASCVLKLDDRKKDLISSGATIEVNGIKEETSFATRFYCLSCSEWLFKLTAQEPVAKVEIDNLRDWGLLKELLIKHGCEETKQKENEVPA